LLQGEGELEKGDFRQAGEKFWGAATQIVKAFAEDKGYRYDGHAWLFEVVDKISSQEENEVLKGQFGLAGMLHTNFYEGWLTEGEIRYYISQTKEFIKKIKEILNSEDTN
jgi:hypothetical protein